MIEIDRAPPSWADRSQCDLAARARCAGRVFARGARAPADVDPHSAFDERRAMQHLRFIARSRIRLVRHIIVPFASISYSNFRAGDRGRASGIVRARRALHGLPVQIINVVRACPGPAQPAMQSCSRHTTTRRASPPRQAQAMTARPSRRSSRSRRVLAADERPLRNDVILLITDGEEIGLLGARAFLAEHRWAMT